MSNHSLQISLFHQFPLNSMVCHYKIGQGTVDYIATVGQQRVEGENDN